MDEGEMRQLVREKVLDALDSKGISGDEKAIPSEAPKFNFSPEGNKPKMVAANWKMHMTVKEGTAFADGMKGLSIPDDTEVMVAPPHYLLLHMSKLFAGSRISLGAQNMHHEMKGAFTGEHSARMLLDAGCRFVILGHSERRHVFGEKDESINLKVKTTINTGLRPVLCVGEKWEQRESNRTNQVIRKQLKLGLAGTTGEQMSPLIVAYEPVWAIGTGQTASPADAQEVHLFIRSVLREIYDHNVAKGVRLLYGGSVKPSNAGELFRQPDVDGFLVGGASLKAESFRKVIEAVL